MVVGDDIRKLSDTELELYLLGIEEMERELSTLRKNALTEEEKRYVTEKSYNEVNGLISSSHNVFDKNSKRIAKGLLKKVGNEG
jgi:hypothetical protein